MKKSKSSDQLIKDEIEKTQKFLEINAESLSIISETLIETDKDILDRDKLIVTLTNERNDLQQTFINLKTNYSEILDKIKID
jgi:hypothetical protein